MPGRRVPGHCRVRPPDNPPRCVCGWVATDDHTKRSGRDAYAGHLDEARTARRSECRDCGQSKDARLMSTARPGLCKACSTARTRAWADAHPTEWERHHRKSWLKRKYGITPDQYDDMLSAQGGGCAICGDPPADSRGFRMHVDHDHLTGQVRGILCRPCNRGIGNLGDDPERLVRAAEYLRR